MRFRLLVYVLGKPFAKACDSLDTYLGICSTMYVTQKNTLLVCEAFKVQFDLRKKCPALFEDVDEPMDGVIREFTHYRTTLSEL